MGRRYSFELGYNHDRVEVAHGAMTAFLPTLRKRKKFRQPKPVSAPDLSGLTPDSPLFWHISLLFPADERVRAFLPLDDVDSEWTDDGVECLPVGGIDLTVRVGARYALLSFAAVTSSMSDLFRDSPAVWGQFAALLRSSGGLVGWFSGLDHRGVGRYPLLPDGREAVELDFFDFVLEERATYWHLDTDRYVAAVLQAPRIVV